jgi:hypothetical protein
MGLQNSPIEQGRTDQELERTDEEEPSDHAFLLLESATPVPRLTCRIEEPPQNLLCAVGEDR